jgi:hypothetical protein
MANHHLLADVADRLVDLTEVARRPAQNDFSVQVAEPCNVGARHWLALRFLQAAQQQRVSIGDRVVALPCLQPGNVVNIPATLGTGQRKQTVDVLDLRGVLEFEPAQSRKRGSSVVVAASLEALPD